MKVDYCQVWWYDWSGELGGLETEMTYYGARAAVGDFGTFGVLVMGWCVLSLLFTLGLALALLAAVGWVLWQVYKGFAGLYKQWRGHAGA